MKKNLNDILDFSLVEYGKINLHVGDVVQFALFLVIAKFLVVGVKYIIKLRTKKASLDKGSAYAIGQILAYLIYTVFIVIALDTIGVKITVLIAGSTALFVGLGLGLQDTFKDFVAGVVILSERTVTVGDIIDANNIIGRVTEVGLRTTKLATRDEIVMIIPNQLVVNQTVINWSQNRKATRFAIEVGVAYGSDTQKVKEILIEVAKNHPDVEQTPLPTVQFANFGNSSLDFKVMFFTHHLFQIERIKSEIRFGIDKRFRESNVIIPFPQRDLWVKQWPQNPMRHLGTEEKKDDTLQKGNE